MNRIVLIVSFLISLFLSVTPKINLAGASGAIKTLSKYCIIYLRDALILDLKLLAMHWLTKPLPCVS